MSLEEGGRRVRVRAEGNKMMDVEIGEMFFEDTGWASSQGIQMGSH